MLMDAMARIYPDEIQWFIDRWGHSDQPSASLARWPTDASRNVKPVPCHSHNDYWQDVPLYLAIQAGCTSVEADVWLFDQDLYVGHTEASLTADRTLRELYINPLLSLIDHQNQETKFSQAGRTLSGVFDTDPDQALVLLVDFKNSPVQTFHEFSEQLSPFRQRGLLTSYNGTAIVEGLITVVVSGLAPFDLVSANDTFLDVFFDAPLDELADISHAWPNPNRNSEHDRPTAQIPRQSSSHWPPPSGSDIESSTMARPTTPDPNAFTWRNSYYGSTSFMSTIGNIEGSRLSQPQLQVLRAQIHGAHQRGLKARYWDVPHWPTGLRNHIWHILIREGVDVLSVDDLVGATRRDWRKRKGWWF